MVKIKQFKKFLLLNITQFIILSCIVTTISFIIIGLNLNSEAKALSRIDEKTYYIDTPEIVHDPYYYYINEVSIGFYQNDVKDYESYIKLSDFLKSKGSKVEYNDKISDEGNPYSGSDYYKPFVIDDVTYSSVNYGSIDDSSDICARLLRGECSLTKDTNEILVSNGFLESNGIELNDTIEIEVQLHKEKSVGDEYSANIERVKIPFKVVGVLDFIVTDEYFFDYNNGFPEYLFDYEYTGYKKSATEIYFDFQYYDTLVREYGIHATLISSKISSITLSDSEVMEFEQLLLDVYGLEEGQMFLIATEDERSEYLIETAKIISPYTTLATFVGMCLLIMYIYIEKVKLNSNLVYHSVQLNSGYSKLRLFRNMITELIVIGIAAASAYYFILKDYILYFLNIIVASTRQSKLEADFIESEVLMVEPAPKIDQVFDGISNDVNLFENAQIYVTLGIIVLFIIILSAVIKSIMLSKLVKK